MPVDIDLPSFLAGIGAGAAAGVLIMAFVIGALRSADRTEP